MNSLSTGSQGADVKLLQRDLSFLGYALTIDGNFGGATNDALVKFQTSHNLTADGVAGPATWAVLDNLVPQGMDISHLNDTIYWDNLSPHIQFVFCKASQGSTFKDPMLKTYIAKLNEKHIISGAYHFLTFQEPAQLQADNFLASGFDFSAPRTLPPALDFEWPQGETDAETAAEEKYILDNQALCIQLVSDWLQIVAVKTGRTPVIYTVKEFMFEYFKNITAFGNYPLWIASYQNSTPGLPPGWNNYTIWQHSGSGAIDGVNGEVDQDLFNGTLGDLQRFATPVQPPATTNNSIAAV